MENNGHGREPLTYRLLPQTDWERVRKFFEGTNGFVPRPQLGVAAVAENLAGEIVGAVILQPVSYLGPFHVDDNYTRQVDYAALKAEIDKTFSADTKSHLIIKGYIAMTSNEAIARIAEMSGMERKPEAILLVENFDGEHTIIG